MLAASRIQPVLLGLPGVGFEGVLYRAVHLKWLMNLASGRSPKLLYDLAAPASGARFTPVGGPPMLYFAQEPETAYAESNRVGSLIKVAGLAAAAEPPTVLFAASVRLGSVLDLTDPAILAALRLTQRQLNAPWRLAQRRAAASHGKLPLTQRLGRAISDSGRFQAVRYQSTQRPGHACLAIFTDQIAKPDFVQVHDPHRNISQRIP